MAALRDENNQVALIVQDLLRINPVYLTGANLANSSPLHVAIVDGTGAQITSFGGGTQYTDAATAATHPIGTGLIFNNGGTYNFVSAAQPLPVSASIDTTGLATSARQDAGNTSLASIATNTANIPASPATSGKQDTGNTSLLSIDAKIPASPATSGKQDTGNASLTSIDAKIPASPATTGKQDAGNTSLASIDTKLTDVATQTTLALIKAKTDNIPAQGQTTMSASTPVAIASDQSAVPISATVTTGLPAYVDAATKSPTLNSEGRLRTETQNSPDTRLQEQAVITNAMNLLSVLQSDELSSSQHYGRDFELR